MADVDDNHDEIEMEEAQYELDEINQNSDEWNGFEEPLNDEMVSDAEEVENR